MDIHKIYRRENSLNIWRIIKLHWRNSFDTNRNTTKSFAVDWMGQRTWCTQERNIEDWTPNITFTQTFTEFGCNRVMNFVFEIRVLAQLSSSVRHCGEPYRTLSQRGAVPRAMWLDVGRKRTTLVTWCARKAKSAKRHRDWPVLSVAAVIPERKCSSKWRKIVPVARVVVSLLLSCTKSTVASEQKSKLFFSNFFMFCTRNATQPN